MSRSARLALLAALKGLGPLLFLAVAFALVAAIAPGFASLSTVFVILADTSTLFVLAAGLSFVIVLGSIDLSVPAVASFGGVVTALLLPVLDWGAFPVALACGLVAGLSSGLVHVRLRVPSFIATLATGGIVGGIALYVSDARTVAISAEHRWLLGWISGESLGVPHIVLVAGAALAFGAYVQRYTRFGRYCAAIGAGEPAARASGIRVDRQKLFAFALSGAFASLAGIMLAARLTSGSPTGASQLLLPAIAAVLVGGTAITGGVGGVARTLVGALIVSVIRIGMTFLGVDIFAQQMVFGAVLIVAIAATMDRTNVLIAK